MMKLMMLFAGVFFSSIAANGASQNRCFNDSEAKIYNKLVEAERLPSPWFRFNPSVVPVALRSQDKSQIFFMNVDPADLLRAGLAFSRCSDYPEILAVEASPDFPEIRNTIYEYVFPGDVSHEAVSELSAVLHRASIVFAITDSTILPAPLAENLARTLIHEMFHMAYQYSGGYMLPPMQNSDFYSQFQMNYLYGADVYLDAFPTPSFYQSCRSNSAWALAHDQEIEQLQAIRKDWYQINDAELKHRVQNLISIRATYPADETTRANCIYPQVFWERVEGSAHYIDFVTGLGISAFSEYPSNDWGDGTSSQTYYFNGATYDLILDRLYPDHEWQKLIDQGNDPFTALKIKTNELRFHQ